MSDSELLKEAILKAGSQGKLAVAIQYRRETVHRWTRKGIPNHRVRMTLVHYLQHS